MALRAIDQCEKKRKRKVAKRVARVRPQKTWNEELTGKTVSVITVVLLLPKRQIGITYGRHFT